MKHKRVKLLSIISLFVSSLITSITVSASDVDYTYVKDNLSQITSKVWFKDSWFGLDTAMLYLINKMVQAVFWVAKFFFTIFASIYDKLVESPELFASYVSDIISATASIFKSLEGVLLPLVGASMATYLAYVYFVKHGSFFKTLIRLLLVFACSILFFSKYSDGTYVVTRFYTNTTSVTTNLSSTVTKSLTGTKLTTPSSDGALTEYAKSAIWNPYSYMNSDTADTDNGFSLTDEELKSLVDYNDGDDDFKVSNGDKETPIKDVAGSEDDPKNSMLKSNWGAMFSYAIVAVLESLLMGLILIFFALMQFVLNVTLLILLVFTPFALIFAMVPTFENILFNMTKKLGGTIILSGLMTLLATIALYFNNILTTITTAIGFENMIVGYVLKAIVLVILWKKRDYFLSILTANRIRHISNRFTQRIDKAGRKLQDNTLGRVQKNTQAKLAVAGSVLAGSTILAKEGLKAKTRQVTSTTYQNTGQAISDSLAKSKAKRAEQHGESYDLAFKEAKAQQAHRSEQMSSTFLNLRRGLKNAEYGIYYAKSVATNDDQDKIKASEASNRSEELGQAIQEKRIRVSQLRQSAHNQKSKERLQEQRRKRQERPVSHFKHYLEKEKAMRDQLSHLQPKTFRTQEV
ncbi:hypothetical protein [Streptococcus agalactiae]|uniref:hypothetical protein n=1 Tax=Streptococcus agalactiae TaxID=1311 RepID=UPI0002BB6BD5|nr:hypothetical protein [Streptococcus agalactiae]EPT37215.1 hypothetical protein SAG0024_00945 [Streptococcus agalactiae FSL C1-494]EPT43328.1 hypothetical protein SAG0034_01365 [Streptococcus agalactiae FSL S3-170]EPV86533.1 hypothetical protein SAG0007_10240 [Streptococcus agalactiae FSL C1-487]KLL30014.1 hypothetical protein WA02_11075 [Streptococcus agalactiae]KLL82734.1 hypothetical protein WA05_07690 [Streptococcus agalactiae]